MHIMVTAKGGAKGRCLHCAKYNGLNAEICIGRLGGKLYEKAVKDQNQCRRVSSKSITGKIALNTGKGISVL